MLEGLTCVYRSNVDLFFYVVGSAQENEVGSGWFLNELMNYYLFCNWFHIACDSLSKWYVFFVVVLLVKIVDTLKT